MQTFEFPDRCLGISLIGYHRLWSCVNLISVVHFLKNIQLFDARELEAGANQNNSSAIQTTELAQTKSQMTQADR
jgi:hypothetical protein